MTTILSGYCLPFSTWNINSVNIFQPSVAFHVETSHLIWSDWFLYKMQHWLKWALKECLFTTNWIEGLYYAQNILSTSSIVVAEEASTNENAFQFFTLCFAVLRKLWQDYFSYFFVKRNKGMVMQIRNQA